MIRMIDAVVNMKEFTKEVKEKLIEENTDLKILKNDIEII